ncbi:MAG: pyridoxamine 5'-phosphate oxidase family protein [Clostridiales Family XIII bacterium]|jgi:nitroimidazol reductase NimA-like FMN-containing flavoprotein (pyridoxamine 5'-phosphate oxidase superfamily)|nr:pyridoxamine 5'-phosphate oxidase family protein [Clostridiales Family XIII bacterium]
MRKADREITDRAALAALLESCDVCRIALPGEDGGAPYIVPMNFGYDYHENSGNLTLWFHCALEGRKLDLIRAAKDTARCGFEMDAEHALWGGDAACDYGMAYASIIGTGRIAEVTGVGERLHGLTRLMAHYGGAGKPFDEKVLKATCVLRLEADGFTGKRLKKG